MQQFPISDDWYGLYAEKWGDQINSESTEHPAKFARALIRRIYQYLLSDNLVCPGDTILDPFGGVGLGACDALANGLSYIGIELEQKFVDLGQGCDCTGISKGDWVRFYGRWDRMAHKDGRHWCPQCLAEARQIKPATRQLSFFADSEPLSASYIKDSGQIPCTEPHRYFGNIPAKFERYTKNGARAILLQGDSRRLLEILQERVGVVVSSPPYAVNDKRDYTSEQRDKGVQGAGSFRGHYGHTDGQLVKFPEGDFQAVVCSPPFAGNSGGRGEASRNAIDSGLWARHQGAAIGGIGDRESGNLASLPQSDFDAVISSPPFVDSVGSADPEKRGGILISDPKRRNDKNLTGTYGDSDGQLGAMKAGEVGGIISSPPYKNGCAHTGGDDPNPERIQGGELRYVEYGNSDGQLAGDTFWSAARLILEQCHRALKSGGIAVFVAKDFVKDHQRMPFTDQWSQLCVIVGFEPYAHFRAWQVKPGPVQLAAVGDDLDHTKEYKSFFRRHQEKNGSPRIDWESVLVFRKAGND